MAAKKTATRANAGSTSAPRETTVEPVFYKVEGGRLITWPDQDDAKIVEKAGRRLWDRAVHMPEDELRIGAARVLHATWIMLRAKSPRARAGARKTLRSLETTCIDFLDERYADTARSRTRSTSDEPIRRDRRMRRADSWSESALPPRAKIDRHRNIATLLELVGFFRDLTDDVAARFTLGAIFRLFPQMTVEDSRRPEVEKALIEAWGRRAEKAQGDVTSVKSDRLLLDAFVVLGAKRPDVENWLKGVPV